MHSMSQGLGRQATTRPALTPRAQRTSAPSAPRRAPLCRSAASFPSGVGSTQFNKGGGNGGGSGGSGGGGGGGSWGGAGGAGDASGPSPAVLALLTAAGRSIQSFPADFAAALAAGKVTPEILQRFFELESNFWLKSVWGFQGMRERLLGDPSFPMKMAIELGIGIVMKLSAEYTKRQENFIKEIDFVFANATMALIADFMLTWLPAPTLSFKAKSVTSNGLSRFLASCPDNAFQRVPPGMDAFTMTQRIGAILRNGSKLLAVGFFASLFGVGLTNTLMWGRQQLDPTFTPPNKPQGVIETSGAYGLYMSTSSNLRYQIVAGILEERGIETIFAGQHNLCAALSLVVRTLNTFVGSLLWVDFVRLLGMQKAQEVEVKEAVESLPAKAAALAKGVVKKGKKAIS